MNSFQTALTNDFAATASNSSAPAASNLILQNKELAEWSSKIPAENLLSVSQPEAVSFLENITHVYTDLDGTLFAPGGKLLANHAGQPSTNTAEALVALKRAGIEVIIVTGRNASQGHEMLRMFNLQTFIGELGCVVREGIGAHSQMSYVLGEWSKLNLAKDCELAPGELPPGKTPFQVIDENGVVKRLVSRFFGKLEPHTPFNDERQVTHAFRGFVDDEQARELLSHERLPLELSDNGQIHPQVHTLIDCPEIHVYHLVPKGTSKELTVADHIKKQGLARTKTLAIGDALGDLAMADQVGSMVMMGNSLTSPIVQDAISRRTAAGEVILYTNGSTADGWVEFANALLNAKC